MTTHEQGQAKRSCADWWLFVLGFVLFSAFGFWVTPTILYAEKTQPFQFSHKVHMEQVSEGCKDCHSFREDGSFTGIPSIEKCKGCHYQQGNTPQEKTLVEEYLNKNKPVDWQVYAKQPPCVFFSHAAHTKNAGLECKNCHGDHGSSEKLRSYQYNRLSGYSRDIWGWGSLPLGKPPARMGMLECQSCHKQNSVRDACFLCHK